MVGAVFVSALRLGLTSFGGPVAHLGHFHREYVVRRGWLDEAEYGELVAFCQALPGPTSSQLGLAVGRRLAGWRGALAAWAGFTLPSALLLAAFAAWWLSAAAALRWVAPVLGLVALAAVTQAVWQLGRRLVTGARQALFAVGLFTVSALLPAVPAFVWLAAAAVLGVAVFRESGSVEKGSVVPVSAWWCLGIFAALLLALPWIRSLGSLGLLSDALFRAGSLVFGGGHVVLPLLQKELVPPVDEGAFLALYGAAQAVPGPLFTIAAGLGWLQAGPWGALVALTAIFLPSFLMVFGLLPFGERLRGRAWFRSSLKALNASVVGLLAWAWYDPVLLGTWNAWRVLF